MSATSPATPVASTPVDSAAPPAPPGVELFQLMCSGLVTRVLQVAFRPEISERLAAGPCTSAELAEAAGMHEPSLYRVLRTATSLGVVSEQPDHRFTLGRLGRTGVDMELWHSDGFIDGLLELPRAVQAGRTGMELVHGTSFFDYLAEDPELGSMFDGVMTHVHGAEKQAVLDAYDFAGVRRVVDVGGGNGTFLGLLLERYPGLRGALFDLAPVIERGAPELGDHADRCELIAGDFFTSLPAGGDVYLLSHIIHDWDEDRALAILRTCREAIGPDGRLLLVEMVIPPGDAPHPGKMLDMVMLTLTGGMERTEAQYADLLRRGGFRLTQVVPTATPASVIEAVPAGT